MKNTTTETHYYEIYAPYPYSTKWRAVRLGYSTEKQAHEVAAANRIEVYRIDKVINISTVKVEEGATVYLSKNS